MKFSGQASVIESWSESISAMIMTVRRREGSSYLSSYRISQVMRCDPDDRRTTVEKLESRVVD